MLLQKLKALALKLHSGRKFHNISMDTKIATVQKTIKERVRESNSLARANRGNKLGYKIIGFFVGRFGFWNIGLSIRVLGLFYVYAC